MTQMGQKLKAGGDVATVAVCLDDDKAALSAYAQKLAAEWTVLCDYKGRQTKAAKDYRVQGLPTLIVLDPKGRIRMGEGISWLEDKFFEHLRLEAFWAGKRAAVPAAAAASSPEPAAKAPPPIAEIQWIFHLKSGGKLKVVSYVEKDGKYLLKLAAGSSAVSKEDVERIARAEDGGK